MQKFSNAIFILMFSAARLAAAQDTRPAELAAVDDKLNAVFKKISGRMSAAEREKLVKAQRAWLSFRDLDCKWAFQNDRSSCLIDRTAARVRELESSIFTDSTGKYDVVD